MRRRPRTAKRKGTATARLADAVYWLGSAVAIAVIGFPFFFILSERGNDELAPPDPLIVGAYVLGGFIVWIVARAAKYAIAGK